MREISSAIGMSVEEYLNLAPEIRPLIIEIRRQKESGSRLRPSASLVDRSRVLTPGIPYEAAGSDRSPGRRNYAGCSEMCQQFANLLHRGLTYMQFPSRAVMGTAIYYDAQGKEVFRWSHSWVRVGEEANDGNVDSLVENPLVPKQLLVSPYCGPITQGPEGRRLRENHRVALPSDVDVDGIWWPELKTWIHMELLGKNVRSA